MNWIQQSTTRNFTPMPLRFYVLYKIQKKTRAIAINGVIKAHTKTTFHLKLTELLSKLLILVQIY